jgi:Na+-transporting methylmalonyl-CoA/oxaloacetate decarboxylase beta subunit
MTTARDAFLSSQAIAQTTAVASFNSNAITCINAGDTPTAHATYVANNLRTEMLRQVQIAAARDILRGTGDTAPA